MFKLSKENVRDVYKDEIILPTTAGDFAVDANVLDNWDNFMNDWEWITRNYENPPKIDLNRLAECIDRYHKEIMVSKYV